MHPQLELLLQIQDLKAQRRELTEGDASLEREEFNIDVDSAVASLDEKLEGLVGELEPDVRRRYQRISKAGRVVVPVINATCYGCFVAVPTAEWADIARNAELHHCQSCGRFLYATG